MKVEIWSDIACPWCYIGKRKFERALADFPHADEVDVSYHSFELSPDTPADFDGSEIEYLSTHKGIPLQQAATMLDQVTTIAGSVGLDYRFDRLRHANTFDAHRVAHFAAAQGHGPEMVERLFAGYFVDGAELSDPAVLTRLAGEVGLDENAVAIALEAGAHADDVRTDEAQAAEYGISGVPFFVLDEKYGVSGAQDPSVLLEVLQQAWDEQGVDAPAS